MVFFWNLIGIGLAAKKKYELLAVFTAIIHIFWFLIPQLNDKSGSNDYYTNSNGPVKLVLAIALFVFTWPILFGFDFIIGYFLGEVLF